MYGSPYPTTVGQPGGVPNGGFARPGTAAQQPVAAPPAQQPTGSAATTGRPDTGPPAGYRSVGGAEAPVPRSERVGAAGGSGQVMYFHKPADALAAASGADAGPVVLAAAPQAGVPAVPSVPVNVPGYSPPPLPPTVPDRPVAVPPVPLALPAPVAQNPAAQPPMATQSPAAQPMPPVVPNPLAVEVTQLPPRDKIFLMYDDAALERAIIERAKEDARRRAAAGDPKAPVPKLEDGNWQFPALPAVVPAGTQYASRTGTFPPARAVFEPGFVVHRRLHFEEKNTERYGWDLGFVTPFVSTAYFYKDVLLWPNSLASGVVTGFWDTNAGKCLPGSPVPYCFYPPGLTITGTTAEGLLITGAAFIIP